MALVGKSLGAGIPVPTIVIAAGVATVTDTSNGYTVGDVVVVAAATPNSGVIGDLNGLHVITGQSTDFISFNTTCTGTKATSGTKMFWFSGSRSINLNLIKNVKRAFAGNVECDFANTQSDAYYGISAWGAVNSGNDLIAGIGPGYGLTQPPTTTFFIVTFTNQSGNTAIDPTSYLNINLIGIQ